MLTSLMRRPVAPHRGHRAARGGERCRRALGGAPEPDNFIVALVDAKTGRWEMTTAGNSPSLPFIRG